jgi:hypothetical protein
MAEMNSCKTKATVSSELGETELRANKTGKEGKGPPSHQKADEHLVGGGRGRRRPGT